MDRCFRKYVSALLLSAVAATVACSSSELASPTAPAALQTASITAEPQAVRPEFLPGPLCGARPPFRGTVIVIVGASHEIILGGLHFSFFDHFGGRTFPVVVPTNTGSGGMISIPTSGPVPVPGFTSIPGASPIPIPGSTPIHGVLLGGNSFRRLPFTFHLGCGVPAAGTLVIRVETADRRGTLNNSEVKVQVGN